MRRTLFLTLFLSFHLMEACKEYYTRLDNVKESPVNFLFIGTTGITKKHLQEGKPKAEVSQTIANAVPYLIFVTKATCKFFLAGVNFYRFNAKKIGNLLCILP